MPGMTAVDIDAGPRLTKRKGPRLEKTVLAEVMLALRKHPRVARVWRAQAGLIHTGQQYMSIGNPGSPDIHGYLTDGRALFVECKRENTEPDERQQRWLDHAKAAGCVVFVARGKQDVAFNIPAQPRHTT